MISFAIIVHNSEELLSRLLLCLDSNRERVLSEVIIVDEGSDSVPSVGSERYPVRKVRFEKNRGYAHGVNQALRLARSPFFAFANPDVWLPSGALEGLISTFSGRQELAMVAPWFRDSRHGLLRGGRGLPGLTNEGLEALGVHRFWPSNPIRRAHWNPRWDLLGPPCLAGPLMVGRTQRLRDVGGLDEGYFLYNEEIDLALRLRVRGWAIEDVDQVVVDHLGAGSKVPAEFLESRRRESLIRYLGIHGGQVTSSLSRMLLPLFSSARRGRVHLADLSKRAWHRVRRASGIPPAR